MEYGEAKLLRIFVSSTDKFKHVPIYEVLVFAAKRYGMAGATVLKGIMGYGGSSSISSMKFLDYSEKLPMVVEIIDKSEKIEKFFEIIQPYFEKTKNGGVVTIEKATVMLYKTGSSKINN